MCIYIDINIINNEREGDDKLPESNSKIWNKRIFLKNKAHVQPIKTDQS